MSLLGAPLAALLAVGIGLLLPRLVAGSAADREFAVWLRGRRPSWLLAPVFAALLVLLVLLRADPGPLGVAFLAVVAAMTVWLVPVDIALHRLPDRIVLPGSLLALVLLLAGLALGEPPAAGMLLLAALALLPAALIWLLPPLVSLVLRREAGGPRPIGLGDAKLLPLVAALSGLQGPVGILVMLVACSAASLIVVGIGLLTRRLERRSRIAFGPYLLLGAWTGALLGPAALAGWD